MVLHPKGKEIAALLAPEAVKHLLGRTDREGRGFLGVKGAQAHIALPGPLELNKLTDQLDDVHDSFDLFFGRLVTVHKPYANDPKNPFPQKEKTPSLDEGVVQRSVFV
jgi:hypothetical protein